MRCSAALKGKKEAEVLRECLQVLGAMGIFCWRNNTGAAKTEKGFIRFGAVGSSDIIGVLPGGRFLAVECKRERGGRLSDAQRAFLSEVSRNGGVAVVCSDAMELRRLASEWTDRNC